ncbi:M48 family metalloprotease [Geodermatophilus sp. DSM 44513]|uniref:M48 family metalloprotease n=1 Tax=Geodermatophilus sp. DSM 44513 TaxID=1528104 RepID=UPI00127C0E73|nr:M48 family metalloprotease [Geodermatophilus sp. DSM 44513]WNV75270.1 M48 family metalloprotease [Geodermatophilus sp. DSM 44513]
MANAEWKRRRRDACRLSAAAPAVLLSTLLVTFAFSWLTRSTLIAVIAWLVCAPLLLPQRPVERFVVGTMFHFRRPTGRDAEWLNWLQGECEHLRCGLVGAPVARDLDWYVIEDSQPNAFAAGRHSIAITTGLLQRVYAGHLTRDELLAVALHEVGHHAAGDTRHGLVIWWLTWPWQTVRLFAVRLGHRIRPFGAGAVLTPVVVAVAICRVATGGSSGAQASSTIAVLSAALLAAYVQPVVEAAISRDRERAADAFVDRLELGSALATARQKLDRSHPAGATV